MIHPLPALLLAAIVALSGAAGVLVLGGGTTFPVGGTDMPVAYVLPPVVALALFQLVFGLTCGRWRGGRFWAIALPVSAILWGAALILMLDGRITAGQALMGTAIAHVSAALMALMIRPSRPI